MKILIATFFIALIGALFIHNQYPGWLADHLPSIAEQSPPFQANPLLNDQSPWIAGYGRVEPVTKERRLAFEINGLIDTIHVKAGDTIKSGNLVASLNGDEYLAKLDATTAEANSVKAQYDKLVAGARMEEKNEAWADVERLKSVMNNANKEMRRRQQLLEQNLIATEDVDRAVVEFQVAEKDYEGAVQRHLVTKNLARKEDLAMAWAEYEAALSRIRESQALVAKTRLISPVTGKVLKVHRHPGENVSIFFECPVITVADISEYQIRAEFNERYASIIAPGQAAYFTSEAHGDHRFKGAVLRVGLIAGPGTIDIDSPQKKNDETTIEAIISLYSTKALLTGLTGDVFVNISEFKNGDRPIR